MQGCDSTNSRPCYIDLKRFVGVRISQPWAASSRRTLHPKGFADLHRLGARRPLTAAPTLLQRLSRRALSRGQGPICNGTAGGKMGYRLISSYCVCFHHKLRPKPLGLVRSKRIWTLQKPSYVKSDHFRRMFLP